MEILKNVARTFSVDGVTDENRKRIDSMNPEDLRRMQRALPSSEFSARIFQRIGRTITAVTVATGAWGFVDTGETRLVIAGVVVGLGAFALGELGAIQTRRHFRMRQMVDERLNIGDSQYYKIQSPEEIA